MRVLVTSARVPHALAAVRSFGEKGLEVSAADCTKLAPGMHSRFVSERLISPPMTQQPNEWAEWLLSLVRSGRYDYLFPTFEESFVVSRLRDELAPHVKMVISPYEMFRRVHHKSDLARLAEEAGVPVPKTYQPAGEQDLRNVAGSVSFPAVIKLPDVNNSLGLTFVNSPEELIAAHGKLVADYHLSGIRLPLVQPMIQGELLYNLLLADHGETVGQFFYKPLRMFPEGNGTAFYRESVRSPAGEKAVTTFVQKIGWHGFIGFDVIIENKTGDPYLIDANPRTTPGLNTGLKAGVDLTGQWLDIASGRKPKANLAPVEGVRTKTLFVEILWFLFMTRIGKGYFGRMREAMSVFKKRIFHPDIHRKDDKRPSLFMTLFCFYFMFVVNPKMKEAGGYCYSCNYTLETESKLASRKVRIKE